MENADPSRPDLGHALDFDHRDAFSRLAPRRPPRGGPSSAAAAVTAPVPSAGPPATVPPAPHRGADPDPKPGLDARGHLRRPPGHAPAEGLEPRLSAAFDLVRAEARMSAGIRGWTPALTVSCPTCGECVGFEATAVGNDFSYRARSACPSPGGLPAYATPLAVPSGTIVAAADLTALSRLESSSGLSDLAERTLDEARAVAGIVTVRLPAPGATLGRRGDLLLVGYRTEGGDAPAGGGDGAIRLPVTVRDRLCLMDHALFLSRCAREALDPERFRIVRVEVPPGSYAVLHRPPPATGGDAVVALVAAAQAEADPPRDAEYGDDVAGGQALALLRTLTAKVGDPYGALVHALCYPVGEYVWSRGSLRRAPRPSDTPSQTPPRLGRGQARAIPAWPAIAPPAAGSAEERHAGIARRMTWHVPALGNRCGTPIQSLPDRIHPHWLAASILLVRTACDRPDLLTGRSGRDRARQAVRLRAILNDLLDREAAHPDPAAVGTALAEWTSLGGDAFR